MTRKRERGGSRLNNCLHQLEGVEVAAESGFGVGDEGREPIDVSIIVAFGMVNLVGAHQRLIDAAHQIGHAVGGIETLVRVHLASVVCVVSHMPAAYIDSLPSSH